MKTYAEIKAELDRLKALNLVIGDWVWLKPFANQPRMKGQIKGPIEAVLLVIVEPESTGDDGLRVVTADRIEGRCID
jgi:hypothetical protein